MDKLTPAKANLAFILSLSTSFLLTYYALHRIARLEKRQVVLEQVAANLTALVGEHGSCKNDKPPFTQSRSSAGPDVVDKPEDGRMKHLFMFSPTYRSWFHRLLRMRSAITERDKSFFKTVKIYEEISNEPESQSHHPSLSRNLGYSPLCLTCTSRLTSGKFERQFDGVREHARVLSISFKAQTTAIQESAKTGCTVCNIIMTAWQDAKNFTIEAKNLELNDDESFGMTKCVGLDVDELAISLNLYGTMQCVSAFQLDMQTNNGANIPGPFFQVFLDRDSPLLDGIKSKPPITEVAAPEAFEQAKVWLADCDTHHEHCSQPKLPILPNRILDVSPDNIPGFIKLVETNGLRGNYAVLTYCWGGDQKIVLTHASYDNFLHGLAEDCLPQTILDAIEVTRKLGIRYIWIDAFCILQDSQDDKQREIVHMDTVYNNSYVTISAASALSTSTGFLQPRPPIYSKPLQIPLRLEPNDEVAKIIMYDDSQLPEFGAKTDPIETRGWTLQEKLLSRRLLIYSTSHLRWVCRSVPLEQGYSEVLQGSFLTDGQGWVERIRLYQGWESTVTELTGRTFTYPEDVFRAVAGIAAKFQNELQDEYVAGLWRRALPRELLWHGTLSHDRQKLPPRPSRYVAPSWSWASQQQNISFPNQESDTIMSTITVKDCSTVLRNTSFPFGDIIDGQLIISAPVKTARLVSMALFDIRPDIDEIRGAAYIDAREDMQDDFRRTRTVAEEFDIITCVRLANQEGLVLWQVNVNKYTRERNLVKYRRIGYFQSYSNEWLGDCKIEEITII